MGRAGLRSIHHKTGKQIMKTIEELAQEYAENAFYTKRTLDVPGMGGHIGMMERAFIAGAKAATRWIPVEKELPEEELSVLIAGKDIVPCQEDFVTESFLLNGVWQDLTTGSELQGKVTHWLPIPPMPEK